MPTFPSKPFSATNKSNSGSSSKPIFNSLSSQVRKRPFLFFGLPFLSVLVGGSFALSSLTQTRYDYNSTKVKSLSKEEELGMRKDRRRVDVREEYFRLQSNESELDEWEPKRIQRPEGVPEWGVPPTSSSSSSSSSKIRLDSNRVKSKQEIENDKKYEEELDKRETERKEDSNSLSDIGGSKSKKIILGPDGKPCRACNSKLAFSQAMKVGGASGAAGGFTKGKGKAYDETNLDSATTSRSISQGSLNCPPDSEELGRSTWNFLHSTVAYYPDSPSEIQQSSLLSLFKSLPHLYPCSHCADNLKEELETEKTARGGYEKKDLTMENAVTSGRFARIWLCGIHNEINHRLGKERFDCSEENLRRRWKDGSEGCD